MSEFKGTPGPWVVDLYGVDARWNIDATNGDSVAITNQLARDNDWAIRDANTSLIAAAPELLEALMSMVSRIEYYATLADANKPNIEDWAYTYNSTDMDVARQAIDKALGR